MGLIESNLQSASHYAQMIMDSANRIESGGKGSKDLASTISGNRSAGPLIDQEHRYALQITGQLKTFVSNVQTIASNFEAVDTRLAGTIEAELGSALQTPSSGFDPFSPSRS
ncbi:TPA: TIGR04197 family type VII secretion effector [Streptococcus suis]